jgi:hypothetical protein
MMLTVIPAVLVQLVVVRIQDIPVARIDLAVDVHLPWIDTDAWTLGQDLSYCLEGS